MHGEWRSTKHLMNRTLKVALGAIVTAGFFGSAFAQNNFPDVPENHWAYEALAKLKTDGLLVGYPDGLFRGNRPASRTIARVKCPGPSL